MLLWEKKITNYIMVTAYISTRPSPIASRIRQRWKFTRYVLCHRRRFSVYRVIRSYWVLIRITDTYIGIPREDLSLIFDPFFSKKDNGTGLDLSVDHGIIEKHGGKITVTCKPGKGASFTIII